MSRFRVRPALLVSAAAAVAGFWGCFLPEAERGDDSASATGGAGASPAASGSGVTSTGGTGAGGVAGGGGDGGQAGAGGEGPGPLGMAATFSGVCVRATDQSSGALDFPGEDFTVQFWLRVASVPQTDSYQHIVWNGGTSMGYPGWSIYLAHSDLPDTATISFGTHDGTMALSASAPDSIVKDHLHHVVVTRSRTQGTVYVFDSAGPSLHVAGPASTVLTIDNGQNFSLGSDVPRDACNGRYAFDGTLDDVRVYSVARTPQEFAADFRGPVRCQAAEMAAYWKLDELVEGGALADSCSNIPLEALGAPVTLVDSPFDAAR